MDAAITIAIITSVAGVVTAAVGGFFAYLSSRHSKAAAKSVEPNGRGTVTEMNEAILDHIIEVRIELMDFKRDVTRELSKLRSFHADELED